MEDHVNSGGIGWLRNEVGHLLTILGIHKLHVIPHMSLGREAKDVLGTLGIGSELEMRHLE